jgi:hypothetical protein
MKPRSAVAALLTVTETLLAAKAKAVQAKRAPAGQVPRDARAEKIADTRPLLLRIKAQAIS